MQVNKKNDGWFPAPTYGARYGASFAGIPGKRVVLISRKGIIQIGADGGPGNSFGLCNKKKKKSELFFQGFATHA